VPICGAALVIYRLNPTLIPGCCEPPIRALILVH